MIRFLQRLLDSIVALVMIVLSLCFQAFFFLLLAFGILGLREVSGIDVPDIIMQLILIVSVLLLNGLAFYSYFKKGEANVSLGSDASVFFYIPRAIDTILYGKQRIQR